MRRSVQMSGGRIMIVRRLLLFQKWMVSLNTQSLKVSLTSEGCVSQLNTAAGPQTFVSSSLLPTDVPMSGIMVTPMKQLSSEEQHVLFDLIGLLMCLEETAVRTSLLKVLLDITKQISQRSMSTGFKRWTPELRTSQPDLDSLDSVRTLIRQKAGLLNGVVEQRHLLGLEMLDRYHALSTQEAVEYDVERKRKLQVDKAVELLNTVKSNREYLMECETKREEASAEAKEAWYEMCKAVLSVAD